jgi:Cu/Ag efflux protein CusF
MKWYLRVLAVVLSCIATVTVAYADDAYVFTVKGIIKGLPGDGRAANEILVKHQPIPDYRDDTGTITGMMAMTMPFYVGEGVSLKEFKAGDPIEMKVEQHLKPTFSEFVTSIKRVE